MRLFTAIDLPPTILETLDHFLARLRPLAKLRWTAVENLHITTKFIGEWPEAPIEDMKTALRAVIQTGPIDIAVRGVGWFPNPRRPQVFWAGVQAGEPLAALARATEEAVSRLGVPEETRAYSPHLTLARVKDAVKVDAIVSSIISAAGNPDFGRFRPSSFFLYLSANGKYSKLEEFPLHS